jgi:hypothetical protein
MGNMGGPSMEPSDPDLELEQQLEQEESHVFGNPGEAHHPEHGMHDPAGGEHNMHEEPIDLFEGMDLSHEPNPDEPVDLFEGMDMGDEFGGHQTPHQNAPGMTPPFKRTL